MTDLFRLSAVEMVSLLKAGSVSVSEALDSLKKRIESVDSKINALPTLCFERAFKYAEELQRRPVDQRGQLSGLPVTIKDLTPVAGVRTTFGSSLFNDHIAPVSDQLVQRIENDGGVVYAKSNTPEFGAGGITFNDVFGMTRSPYNTAFASGGSSGGAAASLASGSAWLSHGSDMAGSLRTPAAFCGVASLRPSPGTIRSDSEYLPFQVLGEEGPMARSVADLALFADVMRCDESCAMQTALHSVDGLQIKNARVAFSRDLGITDVNSEIDAAFHTLLQRLEGECASCEEAHPDLEGVHESFDVLRAEIFAVGLEQAISEHASLIKPEVIWNVEQGLALSSSQIRQALRTQGQIVNRSAAFMQSHDVLICPATSIGHADAEVRYPGEPDGVPIAHYYRWLAIAYATTMTTLPIITLPAGKLGNGMPFGIQLVGKPYGEAALFQIAVQLESMLGLNTDPVDPW